MSLSLTSPEGRRPDSLAVVIVNWNVAGHLQRCLRSLSRALPRVPASRTEVWVVDNASTDESVPLVRREFPWVRLVALEENIGFAAANNVALWLLALLRHPHPMYSRSWAWVQRLAHEPTGQPPAAVLFLNPDTEVAEGSVAYLWETLFANARTGVVGPRLFYPDGSHQHSGFRFPSLAQVFLDFFPLHGRLLDSRLNGRYARLFYEGQASFPVDFVLGAAMMARRDVIEQVGGFDEGYWLYCEEMDWARRVRAAGWEIRVDPRAHVVHYEGQSSRQFRGRAFVALWRSRFRYFRRYHSFLFNLMVRLLVLAGTAYLRFQTRHVSAEERRERLRAYEEVARMAWHG